MAPKGQIYLETLSTIFCFSTYYFTFMFCLANYDKNVPTKNTWNYLINTHKAENKCHFNILEMKFKIIRYPKSNPVTPSQPTPGVDDNAVDASFPPTSGRSVSKDGNSHASSTLSDNAIKCAHNLFTSKYHQRDFCKEADCCNITKNEAEKIAKQTYKFQHSWLNKRAISFCVTTEMWWPVYVEGEGLYCLLCKKHDTSNLQNKSKIFNKEPCKRFCPEALEDHCRMVQHKNAVASEMLQRVSVFQGFGRRRCADQGTYSGILDHERRAA